MSEKSNEDMDSAREIAEEISRFREEFWAKLASSIEEELREMESNGFDPCEGSGRGAWWA